MIRTRCVALLGAVVVMVAGCDYETATAGKDGCDPNYSGCVPVGAVDVDCAGGTGDGPEYTGHVTVKGTDIHGLDADGDGDACE